MTKFGGKYFLVTIETDRTNRNHGICINNATNFIYLNSFRLKSASRKKNSGQNKNPADGDKVSLQRTLED